MTFNVFVEFYSPSLNVKKTFVVGVVIFFQEQCHVTNVDTANKEAFVSVFLFLFVSLVVVDDEDEVEFRSDFALMQRDKRWLL